MHEVVAHAFFDEMEKVSRVRTAVKQYRRMMMLRAQKAPMHSTSEAAAESIAREANVRASRGHYGKGSYWSTTGDRTRYGPVTIAKDPKNAEMIKSVGDPRRSSWGVHRTEKGTSVGKGDTFISTGEASVLASKRAREAAQRSRMHVIDAPVQHAEGFAHFSGTPLVGEKKRQLIRRWRKRRKLESRLSRG